MRKAKPKKRIVLPDPVFGDVRVSKFVNHLMYDGKKNTSYRIFYTALELVGKKMNSEEKTPLEIWKEALEKVTPQVEVKSRRVGGATFQVPPTNWLPRLWTPTTSRVEHSSAKRTCTAWPRLTAHSHTSGFDSLTGS